MLIIEQLAQVQIPTRYIIIHVRQKAKQRDVVFGGPKAWKQWRHKPT